jgi:hypothetical protein
MSSIYSSFFDNNESTEPLLPRYYDDDDDYDADEEVVLEEVNSKQSKSILSKATRTLLRKQQSKANKEASLNREVFGSKKKSTRCSSERSAASRGASTSSPNKKQGVDMINNEEDLDSMNSYYGWVLLPIAATCCITFAFLLVGWCLSAGEK